MHQVYIFTANWAGQEANVRVVIIAETKEAAEICAKNRYPGFYVVQCFTAYDLIAADPVKLGEDMGLFAS